MAPEPLLAGRRIAITRSEADNRTLAAKLLALGAEVIQMPLIEVLPPHDGGQALAEAVHRLSDYRWVVLTSVNGVDALRMAMGDTSWPVAVQVAPVGPVTAEAARAAGMEVADALLTTAGRTATAQSLVDGFPVAAGVENRRVLAPLAELAGSTVVDGLTAKGHEVDRVTAYRTVAPEPADWEPDDREPDAVAFFSPSVIDRFARSVEHRPAAVCVGPSTAARAGEQGFTDVTMADPHTEDGVIAAICDRFGAANPS